MQDETPRTIVDLSRARRFTVRQLYVAIGLMALLLLLAAGPSIRDAGEEMDRGLVRTLVLAVGEPAGAAGDVLPVHDVVEDGTAWLSPDDDLGGEGGFEATAEERGAAAPGGVPPVTPDAFDPSAVGETPKRIPLRKLLVTGDSLAMPLDAELARRLADDGVETVRDAHVGTGISKTVLLDWGELSVQQAREERADAVVVFIGANEGFPMPGAKGEDLVCCGREWAAEYAFRVRRMMDTYRRRGAARVYWLTLPTPRDDDQARVARTVNAGIAVAAAPYLAQVRVLDLVPTFTPGGEYRAAMDVGGRETIVRESDGIHLNDAGAGVAADLVERMLDRDFER